MKVINISIGNDGGNPFLIFEIAGDKFFALIDGKLTELIDWSPPIFPNAG